MAFDEIKNDAFDFSGLEEIQPHLEEIEEKHDEVVEEAGNNDLFSDELFGVEEENIVVPETVVADSVVEDVDTNSFEESNLIDFLSDTSENDESQNVLADTTENEMDMVISEPVPEDNVVASASVVSNVATDAEPSVNISATTINVSASSVVVSGQIQNSKEKAQPDNFLNINSQKGSLEFSKDEKVIREYRIVKGGGKALVTNKRLVLDCDTRIDLPIEKVGGVASSHYLDVRGVKLIFGLLFLGICAVGIFFAMSSYIHQDWAKYTLFGVGGFLGLMGLLMVLTSFKRKFTMNIFGDGLVPVVAISSKKRFAKESYQGLVVTGRQGKDFACFTGEIGALLVQIKEDLKRK